MPGDRQGGVLLLTCPKSSTPGRRPTIVADRCAILCLSRPKSEPDWALLGKFQRQSSVTERPRRLSGYYGRQMEVSFSPISSCRLLPQKIRGHVVALGWWQSTARHTMSAYLHSTVAVRAPCFDPCIETFQNPSLLGHLLTD